MNLLARTLAAAAAALVFPLVAAMPAAASPVTPTPVVGADLNELVRAAAYHDGSFYVGGEFTVAHDGEGHVDRAYLAAVSSETGQLRSFAPQLDGPVHALTVHGDHLYFAGYFSQADEVSVDRVARIDLNSGEVDPDFQPSVDALPRALVVAEDRLYIGGNFNAVNGEPRAKLASVHLDDGALDADFAPVFDQGIRYLHAAHGKLYAGGSFRTVDGAERRELAALDLSSGSLDTEFNPVTHGRVFEVDSTSDRVYAAVGGPGGHVQAFEKDGSLAWERAASGDVEALTVHDGHVYAGGHFDRICTVGDLDPDETCQSDDQRTAGKAVALDLSGDLLDWDPGADSSRGVNALTSGGGALAMGGAFLTTGYGEISQQRVAVFRE